MYLDQPELVDPYEDPVCHTKVDPDRAPNTLYRGHTFYFCSKQCKREFDQNPMLWVSVSHAEMVSSNHGVV